MVGAYRTSDFTFGENQLLSQRKKHLSQVCKNSVVGLYWLTSNRPIRKEPSDAS